MEKIPIYGREVWIFEQYHFTQAEIAQLRMAFNGYDREKVESLINALQHECRLALSILKSNAPRRVDAQRDRACALRTLSKAKDLLENMRDGKGNGGFILAPYWPRSTSLHPVKKGLAGAIDTIDDLTPEAISVLDKLIDAIEAQEASNENPGRGRPEADAIGLARGVARLLSAHLQITPTTYAEGIFAQVLPVCLDAVGLPSNDPSRAIRAAVSSFQK